MSHLTWVRGLKHRLHPHQEPEKDVAPYVGAWIETLLGILRVFNNSVAPYVGAWIETPLVIAEPQID